MPARSYEATKLYLLTRLYLAFEKKTSVTYYFIIFENLKEQILQQVDVNGFDWFIVTISGRGGINLPTLAGTTYMTI